jgi:hypothetical protein
MIDSMILWMRISIFFIGKYVFFLRCLWAKLTRGVLGDKGLKCVQPRFGGFLGVNPGFTHFGGLGPVLGVWFV